MFVLAVDILLRNQFLHSIEITLLGRVEESWLASQEVGDVAVLLVLNHIQRSEVVPVTTVYISSVLRRGGGREGGREGGRQSGQSYMYMLHVLSLVSCIYAYTCI